MSTWPLQDAKAHLSELVRKAMQDGPQQITLRGEPAVIMVAKTEFDRLTQPQPSLVDFMRQSPLMGINIGLD